MRLSIRRSRWFASMQAILRATGYSVDAEFVSHFLLGFVLWSTYV